MQPLLVFSREEDGEAIKTLRQDVDEGIVIPLVLTLHLLQDVGGQEGVLGREQLLSQAVGHHLLSNGRALRHLKSDDLFLWHEQDLLPSLDFLGSVDTSVNI